MLDRVEDLYSLYSWSRGSQEVDSGDKDPLCLHPFIAVFAIGGGSTQSFK